MMDKPREDPEEETYQIEGEYDMCTGDVMYGSKTKIVGCYKDILINLMSYFWFVAKYTVVGILDI